MTPGQTSVSPQKWQKIVRYLLVGFFAYGIEMGTLYFLSKSLGWSDIQAVAVSFWVGFIASFGLQKVVAFKNQNNHPKALLNQVLLFSGLVAWNYVFTLLAVKLFASRADVMIIRSVCMAIIICWNFVIYNKLIFKPYEQDKKTEI